VQLPAAAMVLSVAGVWLGAHRSGLTRRFQPDAAGPPSAEPVPAGYAS
jgi:hypothetical protein